MEITHSEVRIPTGKACEILGVHPNTLRRYVDQGIIPAIRLEPRSDGRPGERRFLESDLQDYLRQRAA